MENENKDIKVEDKTVKVPEKGKMRQIIIETDGNNIHLIKAEVSGSIELEAILQNLLVYINHNKGTSK